MRKLAKDVGVTAPALYRHFGGKEELLLAVAGEAYNLFSQYLFASLRGSTPLERMRLAANAYLDFALEHSRYYEVLYLAPRVLGLEAFPDDLGGKACAIGQFWVDRTREMMDAGLMKEGDPHAVSMTMWAHAHGLVSIYLRGMLLKSEEEFRRFFVESGRRMMKGLGTEALAEAIEALERERLEALTA